MKYTIIGHVPDILRTVTNKKKEMKSTRFSSPRLQTRKFTVQNRPQIIVQRNILPKSARDRKPLPLDPFNPSSEFQEPEYLKQQKKQLMDEISVLKPEVQELTFEFNKIQDQIQTSAQLNQSFSLNQNNGNMMNPQTYLSSQLAELHTEHDQLSDELAKCRRLYSEQSELRLKNDIEYQRKILNDLNYEQYQLMQEYQYDQQQLDDLYKSDMTSVIKEQKNQINALKKELQDLSNNEQRMIDDYMALVNNVPQITQSEAVLAQKKRQLQQAEHNKMKMHVELRKIRKEYEDRCMYLESEIRRKEEEIRKKSGRDEWKKNCTVLSRVTMNQYNDQYPYYEEQEYSSSSNPNSPKRVTFNMDNIEGMGIPMSILEEFYQYQQNYNQPGEEEEKFDEDAMLDLGDFHLENKRVNSGDTFFADTIEQISKSLLVPPKN